MNTYRITIDHTDAGDGQKTQSMSRTHTNLGPATVDGLAYETQILATQFVTVGKHALGNTNHPLTNPDAATA